MASILKQRDFHRKSSGSLHQNRVGLKGTPRIDHFVLNAIFVLPREGIEGSTPGHRANLYRSQCPVPNVQVIGERIAQLGGQRIRVAVQAVLLDHGLMHRIQWSKGNFIRRQLVGCHALNRRWRLARCVFWQTSNYKRSSPHLRVTGFSFILKA